jgi:hypothetical protein
MLVGEGKILKAQARLGHGGPATTLRHYAHATPLDDEDSLTTSTRYSTPPSDEASIDPMPTFGRRP